MSTKIKKKGKDLETSTVKKSRLRYITFDQGRFLIIKQLKDKIDGDNYSQVRDFPNFGRSQGTDVSMPIISWNAKIVRVYNLQ